MKKTMMIALMLIVGNQGLAQNKQKSSYEESYTQSTQGSAGSITTKARDKGSLKGSPYLNEQFLASQINGVDYMVRYNAADNKMEISENNSIYEYPAKLDQTVIEIPSIKKQYVYKNYRDGKNYHIGFLVVLSDAPTAKLFKAEKISFVPGVVPKTSYDRAYPDEYKRLKDVYYMQLQSGEIDRVPTNAKRFAALFPEKDKAITNFIKENKISLNDEKDLITLFSFIQK